MAVMEYGNGGAEKVPNERFGVGVGGGGDEAEREPTQNVTATSTSTWHGTENSVPASTAIAATAVPATTGRARAAAMPTQATTRIDPVIEKRLVRKLDMYLTSLVGFLFLLSFLDRSNIGNAKIAGMDHDLNLGNGDKYEWLLTIFYISYILFQPQAFMWRIVKPHYWAFFITFAWGVISTCQAATTNWAGMMVLRFLLGAAEAGFGPGIPFLLSFFYRRREIGVRCGMFLSMAALASTFAGALAYGITSARPKSIASWRLLFLVEGLPSVLASLLAWFYIPDGPTSARYLTPEEAEVARLRARQQHGPDGEKTQTGVDLKEVGRALIDYKSWFTPLMYFSLNVSYSSLPVFLPTILQDMGFTSINAQGLSAPPYFVAFLMTVFTTWVADKTGQRGLMIASLSSIGGVGYIMLATCTGVGPRYAGVYLAAMGVFPAIGNVLPWVTNNQGSHTRRGMGIVLLNLVGQCGPLLGTRVYPARDSPLYVKGQAISAGFLFFTSFLALGLRTVYVWENRRLDERYGPVASAVSRRDLGSVATLAAGPESPSDANQLEKQEREEGEMVAAIPAPAMAEKVGHDYDYDDKQEEEDGGQENFGRNFRYVL